MYSTKAYAYFIDQSNSFTLRDVNHETDYTKRINNVIKLITWEEFQSIREKFNITNEQTLWLMPEVYPGESRTFTDKNGKAHTVKLPKKFEP